jgi:hypothetical protein
VQANTNASKPSHVRWNVRDPVNMMEYPYSFRIKAAASEHLTKQLRNPRKRDEMG